MLCRDWRDVDVARAKEAIAAEKLLYERDFYRWVETQTRLLKEGDLERLDIVNLIDEVEDLAISRKHAVKNNLVILIAHLLKHQYQPEWRSRSWLASIVEHRRRLRDLFEESPSLRRHARTAFARAFQDATALAIAETSLPERAIPPEPPYTLEQTLDPNFLPD
jgi:hypothetical protein